MVYFEKKQIDSMREEKYTNKFRAVALYNQNDNEGLIDYKKRHFEHKSEFTFYLQPHWHVFKHKSLWRATDKKMLTIHVNSTKSLFFLLLMVKKLEKLRSRKVPIVIPLKWTFSICYVEIQVNLWWSIFLLKINDCYGLI